MDPSVTGSQKKLTDILKGNLEGIKKPTPIIITASKIRNKVLRNLVVLDRKKGLTDTQILTKLLKYDSWVESNKLTENMLKN